MKVYQMEYADILDAKCDLGLQVGWRDKYMQQARQSTTVEAKQRNITLAKDCSRKAVALKVLIKSWKH